MIEYLRGTLLEKDDHHLVLEVGGVGYGLSVPAPTSRAAGEIGGEARLWVRTYVREDTLRLFGFATRQERQVFDIILGFSGIGPSIGLALLSDLSIAEIVNAAAAGNAGPVPQGQGHRPQAGRQAAAGAQEPRRQAGGGSAPCGRGPGRRRARAGDRRGARRRRRPGGPGRAPGAGRACDRDRAGKPRPRRRARRRWCARD
jgi:hypothetical protein